MQSLHCRLPFSKTRRNQSLPHNINMRRLHIIHTKAITDLDQRGRGKILPVLERETLDWAKTHKTDAYNATLGVKEDNNKYFKYLRRLLELKFEQLEDLRAKTPGSPEIVVPDDVKNLLSLESVRIPDFISCTQISMYEACPRKWYLRYALGIKFPKTSALHFGSAVDSALNMYYEEKIKGNILPRAAVYGQFYEEFEKDSENVLWGKDNPKQLARSGPVIIDAYLNRFDQITKAIGVQTECIIHLENGGMLKGAIDILEEKAIIDTKTANKLWDDTGKYAKHKQELQPRAYSLWYLEKFEKMPEEFRYQIVTKPEEGKQPETQLIRFQLKRFEVEAFRTHIQKVWDDIMVALPKGKSAFPAQAEVGPLPGKGLGRQEPGPLCNFKYCEYAKICSEQDGLKIPKEYVSKTAEKPGYFIW